MVPHASKICSLGIPHDAYIAKEQCFYMNFFQYLHCLALMINVKGLYIRSCDRYVTHACEKASQKCSGEACT